MHVNTCTHKLRSSSTAAAATRTWCVCLDCQAESTAWLSHLCSQAHSTNLAGPAVNLVEAAAAAAVRMSSAHTAAAVRVCSAHTHSSSSNAAPTHTQLQRTFPQQPGSTQSNQCCATVSTHTTQKNSAHTPKTLTPLPPEGFGPASTRQGLGCPQGQA